MRCNPAWSAKASWLSPRPDAPLWPGRRPGTHGLDYNRHIDHSSWMRWYFKPALKRAGLGEVRFHDLRHTFASMMFAAGVEVCKVSRWMGHANISTTDSIYAHLHLTDHSNESARVQEWLRTERAAVGHVVPVRQDVRYDGGIVEAAGL